MPTDDTQQFSPTPSDHDRPSPTMTDHVGLSPTIQEKRREDHTLTTREVLKLFEDSGLSRNQRSIERYCDQRKIDCFKDPDEMRYYITRASAEKLIEHIKEIDGRRQPMSVHAGPPQSPTEEHAVRPGPTVQEVGPDVKRTASENRESETAREEYEKKMQELEDKIFNLEVDKRAKDQVVTILRQQIKDDRQDFTHVIEQNSEKLAKYSRRLGQLETEVKQLKAPDRDTTTDDTNDLDDGAAIEAEFNESDTRGDDQPTRVSINEPSL